MIALLAVLFAFVCSTPALAAEEPKLTPAEQAEVKRLTDILNTLKPQHGKIALPEANGALDLGTGYYFLDKADARKILVDAWGNPPSNANGVLGMVIPQGKTPYDSWGAIITYEQTDFVDDKDAGSTDYDKLLKQVWDGESEINQERTKGGFQPIHLVGWAQPPSYDTVRHTMIWARDLQFKGDDVDTLNYDVRLLGRRGVLSLNMVSTMPELAAVRADAQRLATTATFNSGARYADYDSKKDKKAAYGVAGLVAAGLGLAVAKKAGLIGLILLFAKKGLVLLAAAGAAIANWFRKLTGKPKKTKAPARGDLSAPPPPESPAPVDPIPPAPVD